MEYAGEKVAELLKNSLALLTQTRVEAKKAEVEEEPERGERRDMRETADQEEPFTAKRAGAVNLRLLSVENEPEFKQHSTPAEVIMAKGIKLAVKDLEAGYSVNSPYQLQMRQEGKEVIVPAMSNLAELFVNHMSTLRVMKTKIQTLKVAARNQKDLQVAWEMLDEIIVSLEKGFDFLSLEKMQRESGRPMMIWDECKP